jgi:hypothetical protein
MIRRMVWEWSLEPEENLGPVALELAMRGEESSMRREVEASCTSYVLHDEKLAGCQGRKNAMEMTGYQRSLRLLEIWPGGPQRSKDASNAEAAG